MAFTLATNGLGHVNNIRVEEEEKADLFGMPMDDSDATLVYSWSGVIRRITITGTYAGTASTVSSFITTISALIDGEQGIGAGYAFASESTDVPASISWTVHLESFIYSWTDEYQSEITYTMKLIERA